MLSNAPDDKSKQDASLRMCPVIGIGASAGGLDAVSQLLKALPSLTGMAYVLVQHLDPSHESMLVELLASRTTMPVRQATHGINIQADCLYVIPPNARMAIRGGVLELSPREENRGRNMPIDYFFSSLAEGRQSRSVGVVLSGAASDGTLGLEAIKGVGGITFAQDGTAKFDGMPRSAIAAGVVDFVLPPDGIAKEIAGVANHSYFGIHKDEAEIIDGPEMEGILSFLQSRTGVNFLQYKMPTVRRRVSRRLALNHIESNRDYLTFLEGNKNEVDALFDDLLITVTDFFRDPETFDVLMQKVLPSILKDRKEDETIRVWVAGCSTGKEVYSIAIALLEYLEQTQRNFPVQIFGTDLSEKSIEIARSGRYPESISATVSPQRLKKFFGKVESGYQITRAVRDLCIFSRQDITRDPPLAKMDLISCRNLLIYFGSLLQRRVLSVFLYALQPTGCLLLGNSESIGTMAEHFVTFDSKHKIFCRNLSLSRPHFELPSYVLPGRLLPPAARSKAEDSMALDRHADRILLDEYAPSGFLVNDRLQVIKFRGNVGPYLSPPPGDPELDIFRLVREDVAQTLQMALNEARISSREVRKERLRVHRNDGYREVNLVVWPLTEPAGERNYLILFEEADQAEYRRSFRDALATSAGHGEEYDNVVAELAATRTYMQRLIEELRGANEEAQSSNEELQSTNEELQTAKEELQSANEELTTTNEEMQGRNGELDQLNNDLMNLLSSTQIPIVMLDSNLRIRRYTPVAQGALNLIPTDIGRPISDLKSRIDVAELDELLRQVIRSGQPLEREVRHEDGRWVSLRLHPYKTSQESVEGAVLQLVDIDQIKTTMEEIEHARDYAEAIIKTVREPLLVLDSELHVQTANHAFFETFGLSAEQIRHCNFYELDEGRWNLPLVARLFASLLREDGSVLQDVELEREVSGQGARTFQLNARHLRRNREQRLILLALEDVTDRKRAAEANYRRLFEAAQDGIIIIDAETGDITDVNPYVARMVGKKRTEMIGKPFWDIEPLRNLTGGRAVLERLHQEVILRFADLPFHNGSGQSGMQAEVVANLYSEGTKKVAQFNIRDITERKRFDQQLQQTARLESLGILAGGIAHDFNNLLAGILGNAGLALGDAPPDSPYQSALKDVIRASQRAADLTRQMLAYAGKGRINIQPIDLSQLVKEISKLVKSSIPKSVDMKLDLAAALPMVEVDAGQMQQVIMNLVINGAEAIGEGRTGCVSVKTWSELLSAGDLKKRYAPSDLRPGNFVILEVTDDGCGMDEDVRAKIFDPFFTTKFTGRGLGLAAVQGIVRGHHGALHVTSTPGTGSSFSMLLPALELVRSLPTPEISVQNVHGTGLILVVDDEEIVLLTTRAILERHGYQVLTTINGKLGVEAVEQHKDELAAVILDLTMPVMDGAEALRHIRSIAPDLPVVLSSGYDPSQAVNKFGEHMLAGFLHKPSTVSEMLMTLKKALESRSHKQQT